MSLLSDSELNFLYEHPHLIRRNYEEVTARIYARFKEPAQDIFTKYYYEKEGRVGESLRISEIGPVTKKRIFSEEEIGFQSYNLLTADGPESHRKRENATFTTPAVDIFKYTDQPLIGLNFSVPVVYHGKKAGGVAAEVSSPYYSILNIRGGTNTIIDNQIEIGDAFFLNDHFGGNNYAHWLLDWVPRLKFYTQDPDFKSCVLLFGMPLSRAQRQVLGALGVEDARVIAMRRDTMATTIAFAAKSVAAVNIAGPDLRRPAQHCSPWAIDFIRGIFLETDRSAPFRKILIARKGTRRLLFTSFMSDRLSELGFETFYLENMDVKTQARVFSEASVIISAHGAGLSNLVFCNPKTKVLEIFPEKYSTSNFFAVATACELDYYCAVGVSIQSDFGTHLRDYDVEVEDKIIAKFISA